VQLGTKIHETEDQLQTLKLDFTTSAELRPGGYLEISLPTSQGPVAASDNCFSLAPAPTVAMVEFFDSGNTEVDQAKFEASVIQECDAQLTPADQLKLKLKYIGEAGSTITCSQKCTINILNIIAPVTVAVSGEAGIVMMDSARVGSPSRIDFACEQDCCKSHPCLALSDSAVIQGPHISGTRFLRVS